MVAPTKLETTLKAVMSEEHSGSYLTSLNATYNRTIEVSVSKAGSITRVTVSLYRGTFVVKQSNMDIDAIKRVEYEINKDKVHTWFIDRIIPFIPKEHKGKIVKCIVASV